MTISTHHENVTAVRQLYRTRDPGERLLSTRRDRPVLDFNSRLVVGVVDHELLGDPRKPVLQKCAADGEDAHEGARNDLGVAGVSEIQKAFHDGDQLHIDRAGTCSWIWHERRPDVVVKELFEKTLERVGDPQQGPGKHLQRERSRQCVRSVDGLGKSLRPGGR